MNLLAKCSCCAGSFPRTVKQVNAVIKRSGVWTCKNCSSTRINKSRSLPIGSKSIKRSGYVEIKTAEGWIREHVYVMEKHINRKLESNEVVHHIDEIKGNNDINNLQLMTHGEHTALHNEGKIRSAETRGRIGIKSMRYSMDQARMLRGMVDSGFSQRQASITLGISKIAASRMARGITYKELA